MTQRLVHGRSKRPVPEDSRARTAVPSNHIEVGANAGDCMLVARRRPLGPLNVRGGPRAKRCGLQRRAAEIGAVARVCTGVCRRQQRLLLLVRLCERPPVGLRRCAQDYSLQTLNTKP
jgi:hypothetical protein